jgi:Zn finger protein HypA/HybF involved in hydrogenase expression
MKFLCKECNREQEFIILVQFYNIDKLMARIKCPKCKSVFLKEVRIGARD